MVKKIRLEVPFFKQTTPLNCGSAALKMVLAYLGKEIQIDELDKLAGIKEGRALFTIQLACVAQSLGFRTRLYTKHLSFNLENMALEFYKKYADDFKRFESVQEEANKIGVESKEKVLSLNEVLSFISEKSVPIVLIDWNVISPKAGRGYQGHFVPVVGFDSEQVFIHNPGLGDSQAFMAVNRELFDKARKANGTDEDVLVISKD